MHPVKDWWPDYYGDPQSANDVVRFFAEKFLSLHRNSERRISVSAVNLIDTAGVESYMHDMIRIDGLEFIPTR